MTFSPRRNKPGYVGQAIPGCETLEKISDTEFKAKAAVSIGPVKARFEGKVQLTPHPPQAGFSHALTLKGEGQGGAAGFARGESEVRLAALEGGTILTYDAKAIVGGRLAQIGQRLIDGAAKSLADEFFAKFAALMKPVEPMAQGLPASPPPDDTAKAEGLPPVLWVAGLIAIVLILLAVFSLVP
jgi:carbon monoxide dehydrogenase subunit G